MALNVGELYASFGIDSKGLSSQISGIQKQCESIASGLTKTGSALQSSLTKPIVDMGKAMYTAGTSFEAQMSKVQAIAGLDSAIADDAAAIKQLTAAALEMGSTTQFTATEAGEALEYMAMAGWKSDSMLAGLKPIMDLAAASGENLGRASDIVTDAMTAFGLTLDAAGGDTEVFNQQVQHFSDVLAATATNANTNVGLMGESFKYVAPLAGSLGFKIDDVAVALGLMANTGIKGSQAGTSLSRVLQNMIKPSESAQIAMDNLGLSLYDGNGKIKSFAELMQDMRKTAKESGVDMKELEKAVGELDQQLADGTITEEQYDNAVEKLADGSSEFLWNVTTLAGTRGLGAMLAIMNASESDFNNLTEAITHCDGATAKMAQTMLDNAKGDVTIFQSAIEGLEITLWTLVSGPFRSIVQTATKWVDAFRKMDSTTQTAALKMAGLAAAAGPVMLAAGRIVNLVGRLVPLLSSLVSPMGIVAGGFALMAIAAVDANNDIGKALQKMSKSSRRHLEQFNKGILSTFDTISKRMPALTNSLSHVFKDDLPTALDTVMLSLEGISNVFADNSGNILGVGLSLIEGIASGISRNLPHLIPAAVQMIASLKAAVIGAAPRLIAAAGDLALSLAKGLLNTDWIGAANNIVSSLTSAISGSLAAGKDIAGKLVSLINNSFTKENISAWLTNATEFASGLFSSIVDSIGEIGTVGSDIVTSLVGAINGVLGNISDKDFAGKLSGLATSIINGIVNSLVAIGTAGSDILTSVIDGITSILGNITSSDFGTNMNSVATSIMTAIGDGISKLGTNGKTITTNLVTSIGKLLGTITSADFLTGLGKVATTLITGLGTAIGQSLQSGGEIIKGISTMLSNALSSGNIGTMTGNLENLGLQIITAIGEGIKNAAGGAASLITAIGELISTALGKGANGESLIGDLSGLGSAVITAIVQAVSDVADAGAQIAGAIGTALTNLGESGFGDALGTMATTLIDTLATELSKADFTVVATSIGTGLGKATAGLAEACNQFIDSIVAYLADPASWAKLGDAVLSIMKGVVSGLLSAVLTYFDEALGGKLSELLGMSISDAVQQGLAEGVAIDDVLTFNQNVNVVTTVDGSVDVVGTLLSAGKGGDMEGAKQWLVDNGYLTADQGEHIMQLLTVDTEVDFTDIDEITNLYPDLAELFSNNPVDVDVPVNANAEVLYTESPDTISFQDLYSEPQEVTVPVTATADITAETSADTPDFTSLITQQMQADGTEVTTSASANVSIDSVTTSVGEGTDIQTSAQAAVDTALAAVNLTADVGVDANVTVNVSDSNADTIGTDLGTSLGTAMATAIAGQNIAVGAAAASLATAAMGPLNSAATSASTLGSNFGSGYASGISGYVSSVAAAAASLATAAMTALNTAVNGASTLGSNFGQGFVNGISSKGSDVYAAAKKLAEQAMAGVRENIKEGSPSKVMIRSGKFFGDGFAIGIAQKIKSVQRQSKAMANVAVDALSGMSPAGLFGDASKQAARQRAVDYRQLAQAFAAYPSPVLELDGKKVADINANNTAKAQNGRTRVLSMRYGAR